MRAAVKRVARAPRVDLCIDCDMENCAALVNAAAKAARAALLFKKAPFFCHMELIFASPSEIKRLNGEFRGQPRVTDVLSFPLLGLNPDKPLEAQAAKGDFFEGGLPLGSVVICPERALLQAEELGHGPEREFAFLAAHGALHLLGFDHESGEDEEKMTAAQEKILLSAGFKR